jgi:hypothetical protein
MDKEINNIISSILKSPPRKKNLKTKTNIVQKKSDAQITFQGNLIEKTEHNKSKSTEKKYLYNNIKSNKSNSNLSPIFLKSSLQFPDSPQKLKYIPLDQRLTRQPSINYKAETKLEKITKIMQTITDKLRRFDDHYLADKAEWIMKEILNENIYEYNIDEQQSSKNISMNSEYDNQFLKNFTNNSYLKSIKNRRFSNKELSLITGNY